MRKLILGIIAVALIQIAYVVTSMRDTPTEIAKNTPPKASRNTGVPVSDAGIPESSTADAAETDAFRADARIQRARTYTSARAPRAKRTGARAGDERSRISEQASLRGRSDTKIRRDFDTVVILYNGPASAPKARTEATSSTSKPEPITATRKKPAPEKVYPIKKRPLFARVMMPIVKSPWRLMKAIGSKLN